MKKLTTKEKILEAAKNLFADKGYHETAMDAIAQEAGVSKGSLYWYFDSKDDLFIEMVKREGNSIIMELRELNISERCPSRILKEFIQVRLEQMIHNEKASQLFINNEHLTHSFFKEVLLSLFVQLVDELEKVIQRGIAEGEFRSIPPRETAVAVLGIINSIRLEMITTGCDDLTQRVDFLMDLILNGLTVKEGGKSA